jgi:type I restriction enzyme M protein
MKRLIKILPEFCHSATFEEIELRKIFHLVPSKYIEFVNRDENIDFDEKMTSLQSEFTLNLSKEVKRNQKMIC